VPRAHFFVVTARKELGAGRGKRGGTGAGGVALHARWRLREAGFASRESPGREQTIPPRLHAQGGRVATEEEAHGARGWVGQDTYQTIAQRQS
jgi:hypothetical protein